MIIAVIHETLRCTECFLNRPVQVYVSVVDQLCRHVQHCVLVTARNTDR